MPELEFLQTKHVGGAVPLAPIPLRYDMFIVRDASAKRKAPSARSGRRFAASGICPKRSASRSPFATSERGFHRESASSHMGIWFEGTSAVLVKRSGTFTTWTKTAMLSCAFVSSATQQERLA